MADEEDLALQGADDGAQADAVLQEDEQQQDDPIANLASELGWKPKEQWQGDPEAWKPADQFIRDGGEIQKTTARELRAMREQVERLGHTTTRILEDKEAEINARWEAKIAEATEDGDTELAIRLAKERPQPQQQSGGPDPTTQQWIAANPWFTTDPLAASVAKEISVRLAKEGHSTADQLAAAEREVKRRFPEHFPAPTKQPPSTQTGAARNPNPSNRVRGFADMPRESQAMALDMERKSGIKKEDFAKSYWADQARASRSVRA